MTLGIEPSLSIDFVESVWGMRHIEKTPLDLYKWDSSRDTGLTLSGPLNDAGTLSYGVQSGTEQSNYAELRRLRASASLPATMRSWGWRWKACSPGSAATWSQVASRPTYLPATARTRPGRASSTPVRRDMLPRAQPIRISRWTSTPASASLTSSRRRSPCSRASTATPARVRTAHPSTTCPINTTGKFTLLIAGVEYLHPPVGAIQPERGMGPLQRSGRRRRHRETERRRRLACDVLLGLVTAELMQAVRLDRS